LLVSNTPTDARVEVDLCARLLRRAPDYARGFIGLAYGVQPDLSGPESVYLRPTIGKRQEPEPPRDRWAVQYCAFPDCPFDVLRNQEPGRFDTAADLGMDEWLTLTIAIFGKEFAVSVDRTLVLKGDSKIGPKSGSIGLWEGISKEGCLSNLHLHGT
jgi:hypothetical protein